MSRIHFALAAMAAGISVVAPVAAHDLQPVVNVMRLPQDARGIAIAVSNERNVDLPLTFDIVERVIAPDGSETQTPADDEFVVFPAQAILKPGQTQAVRVQFAGTPPPQSRSFTMYATEVPVDLDKQGITGVQNIMRIGASIHVAPSGTQPRPVLASAEPEDGGVRVTIRNDGDRFVYVDNLSLQFGDKTISGFDLANIAGRTLIPPGKIRSFVIPEVTGTPTLKLVTPYL